MRILMIAPEPFLEPRGTPFSVYHRVKVLTTLGYEVDLVTYPIGKQVTMPGLRVYRTPAIPFIHKVKIGPSLAKLPLDALLFLTAVQRLCLRRYRYLHTHEEGGLMGVLLAALFGCQHLYDMHSDLSQQMSNFALFQKSNAFSRLFVGGIEALQKLIVRRADMVIAICPDLEETVRRMAPGKPVYMIENVAADEEAPPAHPEAVAKLRRELDLEKHPVLLYTGTLESYQGIDLLLRSVPAACAVVPEVRYVIVGGKPEQVEQFRLLAQDLGVAKSVIFVGQRPVEEMPQYVALADALLSPRSKGTNTPLKLYSYLRTGKPVLATTIFSHTQILTPEIAKLVSPTAEGLAQGAIELVQGPTERQQLGERAKQFAEEHYSWPIFLEKNRVAYQAFVG